jgi:hypothetical protein
MNVSKTVRIIMSIGLRSLILLTISVSSLIILSCQSGTGSEGDYGSWSFSGYVVDGNTRLRLGGVIVTYLDRDGIQQKVSTDTSGIFYIDNLPYGARSFSFSYIPMDTSKPSYTQKIVTASSYNESETVEGVIGDIATVVILYPLNGKVSGCMKIKMNSDKTMSAPLASLSLNFKDTTMNNSTPVLFTTDADTGGNFIFTGLPVAPGAILKFKSYTSDGITYKSDSLSISQIFANREVQVGNIYLTTSDTIQTSTSIVISNVLSTDGYGLSGVDVSIHPWYILPGYVVLSSISAKIMGPASIASTVKYNSDTLIIYPASDFGYDTLVTITLVGQDTSGNMASFVFDGDRRFRTEKISDRVLYSNVLSSDGLGLSNIPVTVHPWYVLPSSLVKSTLNATITGGGSPNCSVYASDDTVFVVPENNLKYDTLITVKLMGQDSSGKLYTYLFDSLKRFRTQKESELAVKSNVLTSDGYGLTGVPVNMKLWYLLPVTPQSGSINVSISGGGSPDANVGIDGDTIFVDPVTNFTCDTLVTVSITGKDTSGKMIKYTFDSLQRFRTEKNIYPVASNTSLVSGLSERTFNLYDTIWVKFSEALNTNINTIEWSSSSADSKIYGNDSNVNASVWINEDTLFVKPDQRLSINYGGTMGFNVNVRSATGKRSDSLDVIGQVVADPYYILWTNTKDALGNMRQDFGILDSVIIVSNAAINRIKAISSISGKTAPSDMTLDNVHIQGDSIIYKPSLYLKADSTYGIDFDILFSDGVMRYDVLGVSWKTTLNVSILSVNNRGSGQFRKFKPIGDSLTVEFSSPINISSDAEIPFKVNMKDVDSNTIRTSVHWNSDNTIATIYNLDTLPTADFDASPAYTGDATYTRAVKSITFDLITNDGERAQGLKPKNETIELHTEPGLCVVNANFIKDHDSLNAVTYTEAAVDDFPISGGSVEIKFNRAVDTSAMRAAGVETFVGIRAGSSDTLQSTITFSSDAKTIVITPTDSLETDVDYYPWLKKVPGLNIAGAPAINKHSGLFSGKSSSYGLLNNGFNAK